MKMTTKTYKPLLAATCKDLSTLHYPVYVSAKLDGIRTLVIDGVLVSRTLKPIPNKQLQARYGKPEFNGLDGELIWGNPTAPDVFNKTTSCVMTREADADRVKFYVFDYVGEGKYHERVDVLCNNFIGIEGISIVPQIHCMDEKFLQDVEQRFAEVGYEGAMIRDPAGKYKFGRSTLKEQILLKFKRFETSEAVVLGFEELMHNDNIATTDERGYTKRSSHQENQVASGTLGALLVRDLVTGVCFKIGTGFDMEQRQTIWDNQPYFMSRIVSYQHFPVGVVDKPRFPSFRGIRDIIDLGEVK
jgi:DNA ligase-1